MSETVDRVARIFAAVCILVLIAAAFAWQQHNDRSPMFPDRRNITREDVKCDVETRTITVQFGVYTDDDILDRVIELCGWELP